MYYNISLRYFTRAGMYYVLYVTERCLTPRVINVYQITYVTATDDTYVYYTVNITRVYVCVLRTFPV